MSKSKKRKYRNPPIVEALCEIYFKGSKWDQTIPGLFFEHIRDKFPKKSDLKGMNVRLQLKEGVPETSISPSGERSRFSSQDNSKLVQIGENLLVINQLQPYPESFESWKPRIFEMLEIYQNLAKPMSIARMGMRFINKIKVPESRFPIEKYLQLFPHIPQGLAPFHNDFLIRLKIPPKHPDHDLVITLSTTPQDKDKKAALLLDIYDIGSVPGKAALKNLKKWVDDSHSNVEHAFEQSITDQTRQIFEEAK